MIGANDYGFADILQSCHVNWLTSPSWWKNYCYDDSSVSSRFTASNITAKTTAIRGAFLNVRQAMANAGYSRLAVHDRGPHLLVARPERGRQPVLRERLDPPVGRGLRHVEPGRRLRQQHDRPGLQHLREERRHPDRPEQHQGPRPAVVAERAPAVREHGRAARGEGRRVAGRPPARSTRPSGSTSCAWRARSSGRTRSRRACTPTTGARWPCGTACARPTTAAPHAGATACGPPTA